MYWGVFTAFLTILCNWQWATDPVYLCLPVDGCAVVIAHFLFLCIVADPCASTMSTSGNAKYREKMPRAVQIYPCQCDFCSHHTRCCRASQTLTKTDLYAWYEFWQKPCNSNFISCLYITASLYSRNIPMPLTSNCFKIHVFIFVMCIWLHYVTSIY